MDRRLLLLLFICSPFFAIAQNIESCISVLASGGADTEINGLSYTYTIGELAIVTLADPPRMISQGFNQPDCGLIVSTEQQSIAEQWGISIFPNPTASYLNLKLNQEAPDVLSYAILNEHGQMLEKVFNKQVNSQMEIDLKHLPSGAYFLQLQSSKDKQPLNVPFIKI